MDWRKRTPDEKIDFDSLGTDDDIAAMGSVLISDELQELVAAARDAWACHHWSDDDDARKESLTRLSNALRPYDFVQV